MTAVVDYTLGITCINWMFHQHFCEKKFNKKSRAKSDHIKHRTLPVDWLVGGATQFSVKMSIRNGSSIHSWRVGGERRSIKEWLIQIFFSNFNFSFLSKLYVIQLIHCTYSNCGFWKSEDMYFPLTYVKPRINNRTPGYLMMKSL